jgi:hypothetical protein
LIYPLFIVHNNELKKEAVLVFRLLLAQFDLDFESSIRLMQKKDVKAFNKAYNIKWEFNNPLSADLELQIVSRGYTINRYFLFRETNHYLVTNPDGLQLLIINLINDN